MSSSIWLSSISLDLRNAQIREAAGDAHALHRLVARGFSVPNDVPGRSWAQALHWYSPPTPTAPGRVLVQSVQQPNWGFLQVDTDVKDIGPFWDTVRAGQQYLFRLTASPERPRNDAENTHRRLTRGRRVIHDPQEQVRWLARRIDGAAALTNVAAPQASRVYSDRNGTSLGFTAVVFSGELTVNDADALRAVATNGIGPRKAFGMGLLVIKKSTPGR